jgi:hypothetical protein
MIAPGVRGLRTECGMLTASRWLAAMKT